MHTHYLCLYSSTQNPRSNLLVLHKPFEQLADILEYKGDNAFRIRAYRGAARTISGLRGLLR